MFLAQEDKTPGPQQPAEFQLAEEFVAAYQTMHWVDRASKSSSQSFVQKNNPCHRREEIGNFFLKDEDRLAACDLLQARRQGRVPPNMPAERSY